MCSPSSLCGSDIWAWSPGFPSPPTPWPLVTLDTCHQTETVCMCVSMLLLGWEIFIWITLHEVKAVSYGLAPFLDVSTKVILPGAK